MSLNHTLATYWPFIVPLALLQIGLMTAALIHIFTHQTYRVGSRWLWVIIVLCLNTLGPVLYFIIGRDDGSAGSDGSAADDDAGLGRR